MNINLSRREFTRLLELVYMGDQVATTADGEAGPYLKRYGELVQKLYKLAAEEADGRPEYVEEDEEFEGEYAPSLRLETDSPAANALEQYENHVFWDELISRLAERDLDRELDREEERNPKTDFTEEMLDEELERQEKLEKRYRAEFVKSDLSNVFVMFGSDRLS